MTGSHSAPASLLAFVHVHKTGGTSLEQIFLHNDWPMFNIRHPTQARTFLELPSDEQAGFRGVYGHMPFGIHRYVDRPVTYMTFLRDPVERVLSAYAHNLRHPDEPGAERIRELGIAWTAQPLNFICRVLADYDVLEEPDAVGRFWWDHSPAFVPREYLDQAKRNLDRCSFIGLTESYDADCRILSESDLEGHRIYVPPAVPRTKTSGSEKVSSADLTADQLAAIRAANRLDIELHEHALALRDQWGGPVRRESAQPRTASPVTPTDPQGPAETARTDAALEWTGLPQAQPLGAMPLTLRIETPLYAYGAMTSLLKASRCALSLSVKARSGSVGLMLSSPDGAEVLSPEHVVSPDDGRVRMNFALSAEIAPAILVVRNRHPDSEPGEIEVFDAEYRPLDDATPLGVEPDIRWRDRLAAFLGRRKRAPSGG